MTAVPIAMPIARDLFLQQTASAETPALEMFVRVRDENEHHYCAKHVSTVDFFLSFGPEVRGMECLVYRMPPALLNPNYWEPLTRENESLVRERVTGIVTRRDGDRSLIWRADAIAPGRLLRDGLEAPVELLHGYIFRTSGEGLLRLARAWSGGKDRFEWIGFSSLPAGAAAADVALNAHADLTTMRLKAPQARIAFASTDDSVVRAVFAERAWLRRAVSATIRGFAVAVTKQPTAAINDRVADQLIRLCDGFGYSADPQRDFANKVRTYEITAHLGKTEWGVQLRPGQESLLGDEKVLIYYDRISGIWAVAS